MFDLAAVSPTSVTMKGVGQSAASKIAPLRSWLVLRMRMPCHVDDSDPGGFNGRSMRESTPDIRPFVLGDFQTNCFVVTVPEGDDPRACWIVDCGYDPGPMLDAIERDQLQPQAILLSHCHSDHIAGVDRALSRFGDLPIHVHRAERDWCANPILNLSAMLDEPVSVTSPTELLDGGETLRLGGTSWRVLHTPGHSPGGVCFVHEPSQQAIVGDTLFAGSIGRIDFPTSDVDAMRRTIHETLMGLPDAMTIFPGHGPQSTIGRERKTNPFVVSGF